MEKLTIKRIKLNFKNDDNLIEVGEIIDNMIKELNSVRYEYKHKYDMNLSTITDEYLYLAFTSDKKEKFIIS